MFISNIHNLANNGYFVKVDHAESLRRKALITPIQFLCGWQIHTAFVDQITSSLRGQWYMTYIIYDAWYNIGYDIGFGNWCGICYDIYMMYCIWYIWYGIIQSSAVKTRSNIERFCIKNCRNWDMISIRCWIHKRHPIPRLNGRAMGCLLWIFVIKLTTL